MTTTVTTIARSSSPHGPAGPRPGPTRPHRTPRPAPVAPTRLAPRARDRAAERLAAALATWYLDAQAGRRDAHQLGRLLTPTAASRVAACVLRAAEARRRGERPAGTMLRVRRVVVQAVAGRYEAIALVDDGTRTVPVASVLHPTAAGWRVSELARPDDQLPPLPPPVLREQQPIYATTP